MMYLLGLIKKGSDESEFLGIDVKGNVIRFQHCCSIEVHAKDTDNIIHNNAPFLEDKESEKGSSYFII